MNINLPFPEYLLLISNMSAITLSNLNTPENVVIVTMKIPCALSSKSAGTLFHNLSLIRTPFQ